MTYLVLLFGIFILLSGVVILVKPDVVFGLIAKHADSGGLRLAAVATRLVLGVALIGSATESGFPVVLQLLGWLSIVTALALLVMGTARFQKLISWATGLAQSIKRAAGLLGMLFGAFLIYAVL